MSELRPIGALIGKIAIMTYVYIGILLFVVVMTLVLIVTYIKKRRQDKNGESEENSGDKKYVPWRISIFVLLGALILILSPFIIVLFI